MRCITERSRRAWIRSHPSVLDVSQNSLVEIKVIHNDQELKVTRERIARFEDQVARLRRVETNPANYHASASGFLAEIDRMQSEVREYLSLHPTEMVVTAKT